MGGYVVWKSDRAARHVLLGSYIFPGRTFPDNVLGGRLVEESDVMFRITVPLQGYVFIVYDVRENLGG